MLRSQVIAGIQALRHELDRCVSLKLFDENSADWYDEVLVEARRAVLLNEMRDPHAKY
jgi:hypothetical protein|tara:strand:+ start:445 stop:618 length:174 start_codon:yes stop_codon:yes gene_type:complete